jgi:hypothetical protein
LRDEGILVSGAFDSKSDDPYHDITIQKCCGTDDDCSHLKINYQINGAYKLLNLPRVAIGPENALTEQLA